MQPATPITAGLEDRALGGGAPSLPAAASPRRASGRSASSSAAPSAPWTRSAASARWCATAWRCACTCTRRAPWHDHRDELLRLMAELAIVTTTVGKIARDVSLLSQAEVGEMLESAPVKGVGGSSAMPHKRNPVACLQALTAAARVPGLMATLLVRRGRRARARARRLAGRARHDSRAGRRLRRRALDALERIAGGLVVNAERMKANLESLQGLVFSERLARLIARETDRTERAGARGRLVRGRGQRAPASQRRRPRRAAFAGRTDRRGVLARRDRHRARTRPRGDAGRHHERRLSRRSRSPAIS
mgnify:CR=1 FL=1